MTTELGLIRRRLIELEPLAYVFERTQSESFRVCHELHREYSAMYDALMSKEGPYG